MEDNVANQKVANYILRDRGHRVDIAENGKEALRITEQVHYDVILMDVQMPVMNGLDATVAIRQRETSREQRADAATTRSLLAAPRVGRVPIIAMTAHATPSDRLRCQAAGMDGYLCKPVKREELVAAVEQWGSAGKVGSPAEDASPAEDKSRSAGESRQFSAEGAAPFNLRQAMVRLDGNFKLFQEMVGYFFNDVLERLPEIRSAAARGDLAALADKAHWFKGTVLFLGAPAASSALDRVETLSRAGDRCGASAAVESLDVEVVRLAEALRRFVPEAAETAACASPPTGTP